MENILALHKGQPTEELHADFSTALEYLTHEFLQLRVGRFGYVPLVKMRSGNMWAIEHSQWQPVVEFHFATN